MRARDQLAAGRWPDAERSARRVLTRRPDHAEALVILANALREQGRTDEAMLEARRSLRLAPASPVPYETLGRILLAQDRIAEAVATLRRAVEIAPDRAAARQALGSALLDGGLIGEAEQQFRRVIELLPSEPAGYASLSAVQLGLGDFAGAVETTELSEARGAGSASGSWNAALGLLGMGDLGRAWIRYEQGLEVGARLPQRSLAVPRWEGQDLSGSTLLVWREQGLGDELRFASCYRELVTMAEHVVIEATPKLVPILERSFPSATVRSDTSAEPAPDLGGIDLHVPAGAVPRFLRPTLDSFPDPGGFLTADEGLRGDVRERLARLGPGLRVGIAWRSLNLATVRLAHYATLDELLPVFEVPGCVFVNVQYGEQASLETELSALQERHGVLVHRWDMDYTDDIDAVAALTAELDVVVGPANFSTMLAGALGVPALAFSAGHPWTHGTGVDRWLSDARHLGRSWDEPWDRVIREIARHLKDLTDV